MTEPLTITLKVCPTCLRVSPLPTANWSGKHLCSGPIEQTHKKARMEDRLFKEVQP